MEPEYLELEDLRRIAQEEREAKRLAGNKRSREHQRRKRESETPEQYRARLDAAAEYTKRNQKNVNQIFKDRRKQKKIAAIKKFGGKCFDCRTAYAHHQVYDFHHIDREQKTEILSVIFTYSQEKIDKELENCVMLCANCHRIRHASSE